MSNYEDVYAPDLTEETESTLSGSEQFVMFDSVEGKRAELSTIADYIVENGEIDGSDIPTIVSTIEGSIGTVDTKVGNLTDLDTTNKTNIVSAVNEVNGKADTVDEHVGDLSELETEDKTSAVGAINEVLGKIPVMTKEVTGNPIVIDDALNADVVSLNVDLEPVQDLHGYDKPWAAGAGKNIIDEDVLVQGDWGYEGDVTIYNVVTHGYLPVKGGTTYMWSQTRYVSGRYIRFYDTNYEFDASGSVTQYYTVNETFMSPEWAAYMRVLWYNISAITPDDIKALKPQIEEGTTATSWAPYSNICPISGHDSVEVVDTGKNQLPKCTSTEQSGVTFTVNEDGSITVSGTATDTVNATLQTGVSLRTGTYKYCDFATGSYPSNTAVRTQIYSPTSGTYISTANNQSGTAVVSESLNGANDYIVRCRLVSGHTYNGTISPMLAYDSNITAYEPYHATTTTVTLPHTVYGGDVDVTGGAGTEKMANIASYNGETINEPWLSSMDEYSPGATPTTGAQVVYTLATPTDLTTTPTDITLYSGDNVVSSDGDMDMVYVRDIVKVIEKLEG